MFVQLGTLSLIGHSQGFTQPLILLILRPDFEQYFRPFIGIGPVAYLKEIRSVFKDLAPVEPFARLKIIVANKPQLFIKLYFNNYQSWKYVMLILVTCF